MKELKRDSSLQGSSFSELPNAKKRRFTKLEASVNVRKPGQSYQHLKLRNFTLPVVKLRNAHRRSQKFWHSFASPFSGSAWLSLLIALQPPSLLKISCSTWRHSHEAMWLECHHHGAWIKNGIGHWPDFIPSTCRKIVWVWDGVDRELFYISLCRLRSVEASVKICLSYPPTWRPNIWCLHARTQCCRVVCSHFCT